ncbi:MAG: pirin family protein [Alphaproteobacteria bacterium]|nr:pirin family protein [Alphaproteobacteria bacterium]
MRVTPLRTQTAGRGSGFRAIRVSGPTSALNPFLMVDHFWMSEPTFPAHPHAGFAAITYMFEDAQTGFLNRDSNGDSMIIGPGDLHGTVAGRGMIHEETPIDAGRVAHGLQIFLNLPESLQAEPGYAIHANRADLPVIQTGDVKILLVFGEAFGMTGPARLPTTASLAIVTFDAAGTFELAADDVSTFLLVIDGVVRAEGVEAVAGTALTIDRRDRMRLEGTGHARLALFSGLPLDQPVVMRGPLAMASEAALLDAERRYAAGLFGWINSDEDADS